MARTRTHAHTHARTHMVAPDIIQLRHARPEIGRGRVVGVIPEARILPKTVSRHRLTFVPPAQATEPCDMAIADPLAGQGIGKRIGIELRVRPRAGDGADIDDEIGPDPPEQTNELGHGPGGVAYGVEYRALIHIVVPCFVHARLSRFLRMRGTPARQTARSATSRKPAESRPALPWR